MEAKKTVKTVKPKKSPTVGAGKTGVQKLAIIKIGGTQHLVTEGARLTVPHVAVDTGKTGQAEAILLLPEIKDGSVAYKVLEHRKGPKVVAAKYKAKSRYRRVVGSRAHLSEIEIEKIAEGK